MDDYPVTSDAIDASVANMDDEFDFSALYYVTHARTQAQNVITWDLAEKAVTSDATDASVTNTTGEVLPYLWIWDSPAISVRSVRSAIIVIRVRNMDATQFYLQDYS